MFALFVDHFVKIGEFFEKVSNEMLISGGVIDALFEDSNLLGFVVAVVYFEHEGVGFFQEEDTLVVEKGFGEFEVFEELFYFGCSILELGVNHYILFELLPEIGVLLVLQGFLQIEKQIHIFFRYLDHFVQHFFLLS